MDWNIVLAPSIPHFKDLGIGNLQYELKICQIAIIKSQLQFVCISNFYEYDFILLIFASVWGCGVYVWDSN